MYIEQSADGITVRLAGEIDHHTARSMREQIDSAIDRSRPDTLYLDFSGVNFMDSSGVGLIMGRYRAVRLYGGALELVGLSPQIEKITRLAGLDRLNLVKKGKE